MFFANAANDAAQAEISLSQRGRAGLEMLGSMQKFAASTYRPRARATFLAAPENASLIAAHASDPGGPEQVRERVGRARAIADGDPVFRFERFLQRYVAEQIFEHGIPAAEERRAQFEPLMREVPGGAPAMAASPAGASARASGSLELDPELRGPKYYSATEWHLEPDGWDGYDLYGPMFGFGVGPLVFRHGGYAAVGVGDDILQQRRDVVAQFPKSSYGRIYEPGCGGISTLSAVHERFPEAELVGSDLSALLLRNGFALAQRRGIPLHLKQRNSLDCGEPDASFDAVITYALHHELPPRDNKALFAEMFRILKPGGDIVLSDPPPFRAVDLFQAVVLDWDTEHRAEPFFTASCLADRDEELRQAGFVDVSSYALGNGSYPWVTRATKPSA